MNETLVYMTPSPKVKKLVAICRDGAWVEVYKGEVILANEKWAKALEFSYNMVRCERPIVYKTIQEALDNNLSSVHNEA